jgi:excisionase family DNA binding protein
VGASIAQQMINQPGGILGQATQAAAGAGSGSGSGSGAAAGSGSPAAAGALPELIGPAEAATALGVSEADVIASLESGDLKGKKIGAQWRITRAALRDFVG